MRRITTHQTNECNKAITLEADDVGSGNASHVYTMHYLQHYGFNPCSTPELQRVSFQSGPIGESGINGITNEVLYAILIDRLEGWQAGEYACESNAIALEHVRAALQAAEYRTSERVARGVEGTHEV